MHIPTPFMLAVLLSLMGCASPASDQQSAELMLTEQQGRALHQMAQEVVDALSKRHNHHSPKRISAMIAARDHNFVKMLDDGQLGLYLNSYRAELSEQIFRSVYLENDSPGVGFSPSAARPSPPSFNQ